MPADTDAVFDLPERLAVKAQPALVATDQQHFAAMRTALEHAVADVEQRLAVQLRAPAIAGQEAVERDQLVHVLGTRLRTLRRFGIDLCLGRMVGTGADGPTYVGRLGLTDDAGRRLLLDWRSPAAEPFFGATHANPMGLASRRRYRWTAGRITDYWDEVFGPDAADGHVALDDQSAFIASLGGTRTGRMRDVLGTIQADQDAIIRAGSRGTLVVDGGPGTGKTVVALHRTAYLLYADPLLDHRHGGVLFVGPSRPYLDYVDDVLPSLGEDGVRLCTLRDLVAPELADGAVPEPDPRVAALKSRAGVVQAVDAAVRLYEEPPTSPLTVATEWGDVRVDPDDWAEAFGAPDPGVPHNEARVLVRSELLDILTDKILARADDEPDASAVVAELKRDRGLATAVERSWPLIEPADLVGDLWTVPAYLRRCAPWFPPDEVQALQRADPQGWTEADLPWLDAARHRLGDTQASRRAHRREARLAAQAEQMEQVVEHLVDGDDSEMRVMSMLRVQDVRDALIDQSEVARVDADELAGPFAHVVVDEAQELTDAQWEMLLLRCPARSFTVVGDRAQARHGFAESWQERLGRVGLDRADVASLTVNYRTPAEVMAEAEPVIRAVLPDANVPTSIRETGRAVRHGTVGELDGVVSTWLYENADGVACVIGAPGFTAPPRVRSLTPELAKGLEFDLVVLVDPDRLGGGVEGAVDRYVAMTRATQQLVILSS